MKNGEMYVQEVVKFSYHTRNIKTDKTFWTYSTYPWVVRYDTHRDVTSVEKSPGEDNRGRIQLGLQVAEPSEQKISACDKILKNSII